MPDGIFEIRLLPLHQILSAPLVAFVRAESLAARATLDFVQEVGFAGQAKAKAGASPLGNLQMLEFTYKKPDLQGKISDFVVQVPALSLFPIPSVTVKKATVNFNVRIAEIRSNSPQASMTAPEVLGAFGSPDDSPGGIPGPGVMSVQMEIGPSDMPVGVSKILQMLDNAIRERQAGK